MTKYFLFSLLFFLVIPAASAYDGIFSILNETYVQNASELPANASTPSDVNIQSSGHIQGWVDVSFQNVVKIGDDYYIQGDPVKYAVVSSGFWGNFPKGLKCYSCTVDSIKNTTVVTVSGNYTVATVQVTMLWHETLCDTNGYCWEEYYTEHATFTDSALSPKQYPALKEPEVIITQYNNSLYENIGIKIIGDNYTKYTFDYMNQHAVRYFKILHVENGIGNVTELDQWDIEGSNISHSYNEILLNGNLSTMNLQEFDIRGYNAFTSVKADPANFTIRREAFEPEKSFTVLFFGLVGVVGVLAYSTKFLLRRLITCKVNLF